MLAAFGVWNVEWIRIAPAVVVARMRACSPLASELRETFDIDRS
jgi:hypothetical protein